MKTDRIDYETDLPEEVSDKVLSEYLKNTDAKVRARHPDYSYYVSSYNGAYAVIESIESNGETIHNIAKLENREIEEERISWEEVQKITGS